ncbi:DsbA family protein [Saccharopolyspora taberi]|uniref:Thioredoxin domain-containing protein n=1 Tax=Saccharopolyspora taberi TaxID=60895 RepID=A0ABN3VLK8_9PSEU
MPKTTNPVTQKSGLSVNIILTLIVVLIAVVVIGGVLWINRGGGGTQQQPGAAVPAEVLRKPDSSVLTEGGEGKVVVSEFLDYQCPACWQYYNGITKQVEKDYAGRITFVARNFPLDMHPLARPAAQAAEAAGMQGKFNEMYHALYDNYQGWAASPNGEVSSDQQKAAAAFDEFARQIGLDLDRFHQDMKSPQVNAKIDRDVKDGEAAGVSGTPTLFINGQQFSPSGNAKTYQEVADQFRAQIDRELAK